MNNFQDFQNHMKTFFKNKQERLHPYVLDIPNGYQYCPECEMLTPHRDKIQHLADLHGSSVFPEDFTCDICDHEKDGYSLCPRCGWEHDPDRDLSPVTVKVKKHTTACWRKQQDEANPHNDNEIEFKELPWKDDYKCDCPEVDCYPVQHVFNYRSSSATWQLDCSDAREWTYDIMCNVCNYVFEVEDGNC